MWEKIKNIFGVIKDVIMLVLVGAALIVLILWNMKGKKSESNSDYDPSVPSNTDRIRGAFDSARDRIRARLKGDPVPGKKTGGSGSDVGDAPGS